MPSFLSVGPFFEEGESKKCRPEAKILGIFFNLGGPSANISYILILVAEADLLSLPYLFFYLTFLS